MVTSPPFTRAQYCFIPCENTHSFQVHTIIYQDRPYFGKMFILVKLGRWVHEFYYAAAAAAAKLLQSCLTLCDPIDGSPPGSPVPGILQARTLEWVAISFSNA